MKFSINRLGFVFLVTSTLIIAGCGGGSSSGSGATVEIRTFAVPGNYEGTRTFTFFNNGAQISNGTVAFGMAVTGSGPGQQAVIAFREFSGTSSIDENLRFSIVSGTFRLANVDDSGPCTGSTRFDGVFSGNRVSGTEAGSWTCPDGDVITVEASFQATQTVIAGKAIAGKAIAGKASAGVGGYPDYSL